VFVRADCVVDGRTYVRCLVLLRSVSLLSSVGKLKNCLWVFYELVSVCEKKSVRFAVSVSALDVADDSLRRLFDKNQSRLRADCLPAGLEYATVADSCLIELTTFVCVSQQTVQ
jgi:hypothetical protein